MRSLGSAPPRVCRAARIGWLLGTPQREQPRSLREDHMSLVLSDEDSVVLRDLLADYLPSLRREVARTEQHDLRHLMVQRQDLVERLLEQLGQPAG